MTKHFNNIQKENYLNSAECANFGCKRLKKNATILDADAAIFSVTNVEKLLLQKSASVL
jgi:hypothetical protein